MKLRANDLKREIRRNATSIAVDRLGMLVDELHAQARSAPSTVLQMELHTAADIVSDLRKEIRR